MSTGVFLARMQPLHNAHLYVVEKVCKENDKVVVMLGSANKKDMLRNPFSIELRTKLLKKSITDSLGKEYADKIEVYEIPDWSIEDDYENQKEWGSYLYYNIASRAKVKNFKMYYSDNPEIMLNWFNENLKNRIDFKFLERSNIYEGLSATKIRHAFANNNIEYVKKYCPQIIVDRFDELKNIWTKVLKNSKEDFSM